MFYQVERCEINVNKRYEQMFIRKSMQINYKILRLKKKFVDFCVPLLITTSHRNRLVA